MRSDIIGATKGTFCMGQLPQQPAGRALSNILTVDLEDWYHGLELPVSSWPEYESRIKRCTERLCEIFEQAGVRATFFVLGDVAERNPRLVEWISGLGHEVATHGYYHRFIYRQAPAQFAQELRRSIDLLENITGKAVLGHRAAFFSITTDSLWALEILAQAGLQYDSSIFPVYNYRYGIPSAPRRPFTLEFAGAKLLEVPLSTWRLFGLNVPVAGGAYFRLWPYILTRAALRTLNRAGTFGVFYIHPWELDAQQPRIRIARRLAATRYCGLGRTEDRLRKLLGDFRFAPAAEVLALAEPTRDKEALLCAAS
jgi:polysaccharide deacetylase family protein (PEP-CTERM system associated)